MLSNSSNSRSADNFADPKARELPIFDLANLKGAEALLNGPDIAEPRRQALKDGVVRVCLRKGLPPPKGWSTPALETEIAREKLLKATDIGQQVLAAEQAIRENPSSKPSPVPASFSILKPILKPWLPEVLGPEQRVKADRERLLSATHIGRAVLQDEQLALQDEQLAKGK